ncbi:hypothetical protein B9Z55_007335 [Caenorhabditis nigoni]|uniref:C-type lectin domain-containing protein n=1 Tax=Caenorhabditis nigoni TaxID=1611254 RepID=A0A2G5V961_9PELO|nr:hypothetical protein B9Z55_007335 [Caenorhabditis nigoni]
MIRISGRPTSSQYPTFETIDIPWDKCIVKCRTDINCSAVFKISDIRCHYYLFGSLSTFEQVDFAGREIALKIQLPGNKCPTSNPLVSGPTYLTQTINNQLYKTTVTLDSSSGHSYNVTYSVYTCPNNTKPFPRVDYLVNCIGLFFFDAPRCNNYTQASALCKAQNGTLTGPANADEYEYIQDITNSSKYTSNPDSYTYLTYWIDGYSTYIEFSYWFEDYTHNESINYTWAAGSPKYKGTGYCLHNPAPTGSYIWDSPCNYTLDAKSSVCWRGALCQIPSIFEIF